MKHSDSSHVGSPQFIDSFPKNARGIYSEKIWEKIFYDPKNEPLISYFLEVEVYIQKGPFQHFFPNDPQVYIHPITPVKEIKKQRGKIDLVICGFVTSKTDILFLTEMTETALHAGKTVLFLTRHQSIEHLTLIENFSSFISKNKLIIFNPYSFEDHESGAPELETILMQAELRWYEFNNVLKKEGLCIPSKESNSFFQVASMEFHFENYKEFIFPNNLITRTNYKASHSIFAKYNQGVGGKSVSFQHSVITGRPGFFPAFHNHFFCLGTASADLFQKVAENETPALKHLHISKTNYIPYGASLNNSVMRESEQFHKKKILFIDQSSHWALPYFGLSKRVQNFTDFTADLLPHLVENEAQLVIRPHPEGIKEGYWNTLDTSSGHLVLSDSKKNITHDIQSASIIVGFFSQGLILAAKGGFPTLFLKEEGDYFPIDLESFTPFTYDLVSLKNVLIELLSDEIKYQTYSLKIETTAKAYLTDKTDVMEEILKLFHI